MDSGFSRSLERADGAYSGVVYIQPAYVGPIRENQVVGHWEPSSGEPQSGPGWVDPQDAIAWGRSRAPEVYLRFEVRIHKHQYLRADGMPLRLNAPVETCTFVYAVGDRVRDKSAFAPDGFRPWPSRVPSPTGTVADFGGVVYLEAEAERPELWPLRGYLACWEARHGAGLLLAEVATPDVLVEVSDAVAWARQRAPMVLVCSGPPDYEYWSAGAVFPPGLEIPAWQPHQHPNRATQLRVPTEGVREPRAYARGRTFPVEEHEPYGG